MKNPSSAIAEAKKTAKEHPPTFDLIAGNVCLDFVNTLDDRHTDAPKELLETYLDLVRFGEDAGFLESRQVEWLVERSYLDPGAAQKVLHWGRELREAIHDLFWAIINQRAVPAAALARLNDAAQGAAMHLRLVPVKGGSWPATAALLIREPAPHRRAVIPVFKDLFDDLRELDSLLWPIARAAGDLLASPQLPYVRACFSKSCEWFFLDTSKNHHRRWCDMTRCGNRAKVQRFYERQRKGSS